MRRFFEETLMRPLGALLSGVELMGRRVDAGRMFDGMMSRVVHTLSTPLVARREPTEDGDPDRREADARGRRPLE
ncbi:MAG TPA: hypothetical protein VM936_08405 [Pyrinomonadaceae bacterium]|jgi:hypothetical protein|nr:hypothetical protein [Pyrinomonadaceae bacterium]